MNPIGNELILCYQSYNDTVDFRKFGNTLLIEECNINLALLANNNYTTYFYQMYLKLGENFKSIIIFKILYLNICILKKIKYKNKIY